MDDLDNREKLVRQLGQQGRPRQPRQHCRPGQLGQSGQPIKIHDHMLLISNPFSLLRPFWLFDIILIQLYIMANMDSTLDDGYVDFTNSNC